jgi:hypothetical protein
MKTDTRTCSPKKHQQPGTLRAIQILTAEERLAEVAEILAAGLIRLRHQKSSQKSADCGEISLDILADQSSPDCHITRENRP